MIRQKLDGTVSVCFLGNQEGVSGFYALIGLFWRLGLSIKWALERDASDVRVVFYFIKILIDFLCISLLKYMGSIDETIKLYIQSKSKNDQF